MTVRSVGVEEELLLVEPRTGQPRAVAGTVLQAARAAAESGGSPGAGAADHDAAGALDFELQRQQLETAALRTQALCHVSYGETRIARQLRRWADLAERPPGRQQYDGALLEGGGVMGEVALLVSEEGDGLRERLDAEINAFNVAATGYADARLLCIAARDDGGDLWAGLSGWTWGGCAYLEFLWVRQGHRGPGPGSRLLAAAEHEARRRGCGQVALSTHSFQAPGFYARFGYSECGRTPACPRGYDQIHLVKQLR